LAIADDGQWRSLLRLADGQGWGTDMRFQTVVGRLENASALDDHIADWTAGFDRDVLVAMLRAADIASSPVLSLEEMWRDPHFEARRMKRTVDIPVYGKEDVFKAPWRFSDFSPEITHAGPTTGEHNARVFGDLLSLSLSEVEDMEQRGIIA
jgi:crotonobetainyl-CoA:carnitine CoA-transferase CaiB-like acyl-CoA transferase